MSGPPRRIGGTVVFRAWIASTPQDVHDVAMARRDVQYVWAPPPERQPLPSGIKPIPLDTGLYSTPR